MEVNKKSNMIFFDPYCSANKLSDIIKIAKNDKKQDEYNKKYKNILSNYGIGITEANAESFNYGSFYTSLIENKKNNNFIADVCSLNKQYYELKQVEEAAEFLRNQFNRARKDYLIPSLVSINNEQAEKDGKQPIFLGLGTAEEVLSQWIDRNIKDAYEYNKDVMMHYEDVDGTKKCVQVQHKVDIEYDEDGNIIARPNGHWIGNAPEDSFRVNYYWDVKNSKWIPVCLTLIHHLDFKAIGNENGPWGGPSMPFDEFDDFNGDSNEF